MRVSKRLAHVTGFITAILVVVLPVTIAVAEEQRYERRTFSEWEADLKDLAPGIRRKAVEALGAFGPRAITKIIPLVIDRDERVRGTATEVLSGLGQEVLADFPVHAVCPGAVDLTLVRPKAGKIEVPVKFGCWLKGSATIFGPRGAMGVASVDVWIRRERVEGHPEFSWLLTIIPRGQGFIFHESHHYMAVEKGKEGVITIQKEP